MPRLNPLATSKLQPAQATKAQQHLFASLVPEDTAIQPYHFLLNPQSLGFRTQANYGTNSTSGTNVQRLQYHNSEGLQLDIPDLILQGSCGQSIKPLLDSMVALTKSDVAKGKFNTPVVSLQWGSRRFGPAVVMSVEFTETNWNSQGEPTRATGRMSLAEVPKPLDATQAKVPEKAPMTERQQADGSAAGKTWLTQNIRKLPLALQQRVTANKYKLSTDAKTGEVKVTDERGKVLQTIGTWNGREFKP